MRADDESSSTSLPGRSAPDRTPPRRPLTPIAFAGILAAGLVGLGLVAAAPLGLVDPYPDPPRDAIEGPLGSTRALTNPQDLHRRAGEELPEYFDRLARTIGEVTVHYWHQGDRWEDGDIPFTRVSPWVNYVLWVAGSHPRVGEFRTTYQFLTPGLAFCRGHGFCSQWARTAYSILRDQGIAASVMQNDGHVVVESNGFVIDADYGVTVPHPLARLVEHPEDAAPHYAAFPDSVPLMIEVYARPWTQAATDADFDFIRAVEEQAERVKWLLPSAMAIVGLVGLAFTAGRSHAS